MPSEADGSSGPGFGEEGDKEEGRDAGNMVRGSILREKNAPEREKARNHGAEEVPPNMTARAPLTKILQSATSSILLHPKRNSHNSFITALCPRQSHCTLKRCARTSSPPKDVVVFNCDQTPTICHHVALASQCTALNIERKANSRCKNEP